MEERQAGRGTNAQSNQQIGKERKKDPNDGISNRRFNRFNPPSQPPPPHSLVYTMREIMSPVNLTSDEEEEDLDDEHYIEPDTVDDYDDDENNSHNDRDGNASLAADAELQLQNNRRRKRRRRSDRWLAFPPNAVSWRQVHQRMSAPSSGLVRTTINTQTLQAAVILHLGYVLPLDPTKKRPVIEAICQCWSLLVPCTVVEEALPLLRQVLEQYGDTMKGNTVRNDADKLVESCLRVINNVPPSELWLVAQDSLLLERIAVQSTHHQLAYDFLRKISTNEAAAKPFYTACCFLEQVRPQQEQQQQQQQQQQLRSKRPVFDHQRMVKDLYELGVSLQDTNGNDSDKEQHGNSVDEYCWSPPSTDDTTKSTLGFVRILSTSVLYTESIADCGGMLYWLKQHHACETLSNLVTFSPHRRDMMACLVALFRDESITENKEQCLPGLCAAVEHGCLDDWSDKLLPALQRALKTDRARKQHNWQALAGVVCQRMSRECRTDGSRLDHDLLYELLTTSNDDSVREMALTVLHQSTVLDTTQRNAGGGTGGRPGNNIPGSSIMRSPKLLDAVTALVNSQGNVSEQAMSIIQQLAQQEAHWFHLARQPRLLVGLVGVIGHGCTAHGDGNNNDSSSSGSGKLKALKVLWNLSTLSANQRLLAKQPGLLSCLIRCVRAMTVQDEESLQITREDWKDRILSLARWL